MRLSGTNSTNTEGYVEAFDENSGQWGNICDNSFSIIDAHVVCKMLGYHTAIEALTNSDAVNLFGTEPSGSDFTIDNLDCSEYDTSIFDCSLANEHTSECAIAGVKCAKSKLWTGNPT